MDSPEAVYLGSPSRQVLGLPSRVPAVCPRCDLYAATTAGCHACGAPDVLPTRVTVVVTGASGSGKTTVAEHLHDLLPAHVVADTDNFLDTVQFGEDAYFNVLLEFAYTVIQGGRTPVLCGTLLPERLQHLPARDLLTGFRFINLDCSDDVRTERLRSRPTWRKSSAPDFITHHVEFAAQLRRREDMATIDATAMSPLEAACAIAALLGR